MRPIELDGGPDPAMGSDPEMRPIELDTRPDPDTRPDSEMRPGPAMRQAPETRPVEPEMRLPRTGPPVPEPFSLLVLLVLAAGGICGCLARYGLGLLLPTSPGSWPTSTFVINLLGCFALGALLEHLNRRGPDSLLRRLLRVGLGTGVIGTFTTYSTLAVEIDLFIRDHDLLLAPAYAVASLAGGLLAVAAGITATTLLTGSERGAR